MSTSARAQRTRRRARRRSHAGRSGRRGVSPRSAPARRGTARWRAAAFTATRFSVPPSCDACPCASSLALAPRRRDRHRGASSSREDDEPAASDTGSLTMVGDSLNVGMEPYLEESSRAGASTRTTWSVGAATTGSRARRHRLRARRRGRRQPRHERRRRIGDDSARTCREAALSSPGPIAAWFGRRSGATAPTHGFNEVLGDEARSRTARCGSSTGHEMVAEDDPSGSSATACTAPRRDTPRAPRRPPRGRATACRRRPG